MTEFLRSTSYLGGLLHLLKKGDDVRTHSSKTGRNSVGKHSDVSNSFHGRLAVRRGLDFRPISPTQRVYPTTSERHSESSAKIIRIIAGSIIRTTHKIFCKNFRKNSGTFLEQFPLDFLEELPGDLLEKFSEKNMEELLE